MDGLTTLLRDGGLILWIIMLLSLAAGAIIIERFLFFRRIRVDEDTLIARLKATLEKGHHDEALSICESNPSPLTNLMKVGIENRHKSPGDIRDLVLSAANLETPRLERSLNALGTIAHISPLLGLLGTVTGNIEAFGVLGKFGAVGDPSLLASGIAEALITTAAGLIVSIPAIVFYNHLVNRVNHIIIRLENRVNELVLFLGGA
ncbi:MotA/TolQ/ExbB proton channel family protein [Marispirochaeta sp.]|jgi:biopolymer transport protein ExbB|uniref:MotA/TolQ/ExbB proton channel family protein n=1 Tax=Marispirochaeta sp. TaxID=2038653 RepID=UPI0029C675D9|nr:MotA/TolQ/ExbB proton channel family protein [Marispirochaeta sp.]